ncbi:MAG: FAD-dependent oxidoreductase, partial [Gemmatimonadota bacterium]|nr:FAD-dependent oxidoreductase [Gemmatimonadota bacterium]
MNRPPLPKAADVVIVGAGISGLACARRLVEKGRDTLVVDSADAVGGRIRTDEVDGFLLDRGFQVLLTAYEEFQKQFDPTDLDLKRFTPGSVVWTGGSLEVLGDPFRTPASALASARARVGSIDDKLRVARLRRQLLSSPAEAAFEGTDRSTLDELRSEGFSDDFIDTFFRPFMGGVFLERALETSARLFRYYFRCFAEGDAAIPARGMQRLPEQLAQPLQDRVLLNTTVRDVKSGRVTLDDGSEI